MKQEFGNNSYIEASAIDIGKNFTIGNNVQIKVRKQVIIGNNCRFGNDVKINAETLSIGNHFFHLTPGLEIGGGGSQFEDAHLTIGDRCVMHNNYINIAEPVIIGNDVGLSPDVKMITHGFWASCLEGYPTVYEPITIGNNVVVGQGTMILPGTEIPNNAVIGAASVVTKNLDSKARPAVYAGNPAKFIRYVVKPPLEKRKAMAEAMLLKFLDNNNPVKFKYDFPLVYINNFRVNLQTRGYNGEEDETTIKFRDHLRRYGIRIYTDKGF
jgi:acetyltransferase-like isoleucine patch superfamily enzyme